MEVVAQLVRASVCGTEGRGFEPHQSPFFQYSPFLFIQGNLRFRLSWIEDRFEALSQVGRGFPACSANMQTGSPISLPSFNIPPFYLFKVI